MRDGWTRMVVSPCYFPPPATRLGPLTFSDLPWGPAQLPRQAHPLLLPQLCPGCGSQRERAWGQAGVSYLLPAARSSLPAPCPLPACSLPLLHGPLGFSPHIILLPLTALQVRRPGPGSRQGQGQNFVSQLEDRTLVVVPAKDGERLGLWEGSREGLRSASGGRGVVMGRKVGTAPWRSGRRLSGSGGRSRAVSLPFRALDHTLCFGRSLPGGGGAVPILQVRRVRPQAQTRVPCPGCEGRVWTGPFLTHHGAALQPLCVSPRPFSSWTLPRSALPVPLQSCLLWGWQAAPQSRAQRHSS